jgi:hypothetical protein
MSINYIKNNYYNVIIIIMEIDNQTNLDSRNITFQFSHPIFWGFQVKIPYSNFELKIRDSTTIQDIINFCVTKMEHFFDEHNLLGLKEMVQEERNMFHIHSDIESLHQIYYLIKNENISIHNEEMLRMLYEMKIIYICNTNCCMENSGNIIIQEHTPVEEKPNELKMN